jgi:hypothetical protein
MRDDGCRGSKWQLVTNGQGVASSEELCILSCATSYTKSTKASLCYAVTMTWFQAVDQRSSTTGVLRPRPRRQWYSDRCCATEWGTHLGAGLH